MIIADKSLQSAAPCTRKNVTPDLTHSCLSYYASVLSEITQVQNYDAFALLSVNKNGHH